MNSSDPGCPDDERVFAIIERTADETERATVLAHVDTCARCRELVGVLARSGDRRPRALQPGTCIGDYELVRVVGAGGMGIVYEAYDRELDRRVAVKIRSSLVDDASGDRRMLQESRAIAGLDHPNVVAVYHVDRWQGHLYMVMAFVDGTTLSAWLAAEPRSWREIARVFHAAGQGLAAAHGKGVVHRDFKPDNVLVHRDGRVQVSDFGLAVRDADLEVPARAGTPAYAAPEVLRGDKADARSDQFSFAVALYEALWGQHPFPHRSRSELYEAVRSGAWRAPPARTPVPRAIRREIVRAFDPDPDRRARSLAPLLDALARSHSRRRRWLPLAALGIAAAAGVAVVAWSRRDPEATCVVGLEARAAAVWSPWRKAAIRAALGADTGRSAALRWQYVERALDRQASAWVAAAADRCRASTEPAAAAEARAACLDDRLHELDATLQVLATPDRVIASHAIETAEALARPSTCTTAERAPRPSSPGVAAEVAALRQQVGQAIVLARAGHVREAQAQVAPLEHRAEQLGYRAVLAEIQLALGNLRTTLEGPAAVESVYRRAALNGEAARHDEVAAEAWIRMMRLAAESLHEAARTRDYTEHADAALERLGRPPNLEGLFLLHRGIAAWELDADAPRALELYAKARDQLQGEAPRDVVRALRAMSEIYRVTDQPERALDLERQILADQLRQLGPDHPTLAAAYANLAIALGFLGRYDEAIENGEHALALREISAGVRSYDYLSTLTNVGGMYMLAGRDQPARLEQAVRTLRRASELSHAVNGPEHLQTLTVRIVLADALGQQRRWAEADGIYAAVLPRLEHARAPDRTLASARANYANVLVHLDRFADAYRLARLAADHFERIAAGKPTRDLGSVLTVLAAAELGIGRDATGTATRALAIVRASHPAPVDLRETLEVVERARAASPR